MTLTFDISWHLEEREESEAESDAGGEKEEDEWVYPKVPACTDLPDNTNKLVNLETIDLAEDIDEDEMAELKGVQVATQVEKEPDDTLC